jgi:stage IV sporulation protein FB
MIEFPGKIPLSIHPWFWVFACMIGWLSSQSFLGMLIWVMIILVSVIVHEFGHALTAVFFKQKARIQLIAFGGVTSFEGPKLKFWQQFLITLNGPLFGFFLFLFATLLLQLSLPPLLMTILKATQIANLFWTVVNLLPVLPLDGGQLLRIALEAAFGVKGFRASLLIGTILAAICSFYFFMLQAFLLGAFFFLFAYQSFDSWRKSKSATVDDREEENKALFMKAEEALLEGRVEAARSFLEEIKEKAGKGVLAMTALQYLAFIDIKEGKREESYNLLLSIKDHLADDSLCLLHELAAEHQNWAVVRELAVPCYQMAQSGKAALNNARAFAESGEAKPAGGWLQTAWQSGGVDVSHVLKEELFLKVKDEPDFKDFIDRLQ